MNFQEAEEHYRLLSEQLRKGQISQQLYRDEINRLRLTGPGETMWRIRPDDGSWFRWDGSTWVSATPPHHNITPTMAPKKKRRWWLTCGLLFLLSICCLLLAGGGGYLAVQAGSLSLLQLSADLSGYAQIDLANLDDHTLSIEYNQLDVPSEESDFDRLQLESFDMGSFPNLEPGRYALEFDSTENELLRLSCTVRLENRHKLQFVAVPEGVAISWMEKA